MIAIQRSQSFWKQIVGILALNAFHRFFHQGEPVPPNDIRLKNSRIGIETILYEYIYRARTPEEIWQIYPTLSLEQIHATILYYLHEKEQVSQYLANWLEHCRQGEQEQDLTPPCFCGENAEIKGRKVSRKYQ